MAEAMTLQSARERAAAQYPEFLTDTRGNTHPCIPRAAILRGEWDHGRLVRDQMGTGDEVRAALVAKAEEVGDE